MQENTMAVAIPTAAIVPESERPARRSRAKMPVLRRALLLIRRSHLYFGLLLVPWALLYGITGYLFNHPTHFSETKIESFGQDVLAGTAVQSLPDPRASARLIVAELNNRFPNEGPLKLNDSAPSAYVGEYYFANAQNGARTFQVLINRNGSGGTIREQPRAAATQAGESAPFAIVPRRQEAASIGLRSGRAAGLQAVDAAQADGRSVQDEIPDPKSTPLHISRGLDQLATESLPIILTRLGIAASPSGIRLTSAPELEFQVTRDQRDWTVRYNSVTGSVSAHLTSAVSAGMSWRKFLTRMHVAHGYPSERNTRWFWAVIVDVMAFVMVFWGVSGLVMWWQLKRTRPWGTLVLAFSFVAAALLASGMLQSLR